mgnify:CR=1 FL=1
MIFVQRFFMLHNKSIKQFLVCAFAFICLSKSSAQLNSIDGYFGPHKFLNTYAADPKQPTGWTYGLRYNLDFSWEWAAMFSAGLDNSTINMATGRDILGKAVYTPVKSSYLDFGLGLEWQWMTEIRTRMGGGKVSMRGSKDIIMANFKSYLLGGLNYKMKMSSNSDYSAKSILNYYAGICVPILEIASCILQHQHALCGSF